MWCDAAKADPCGYGTSGSGLRAGIGGGHAVWAKACLDSCRPHYETASRCRLCHSSNLRSLHSVALCGYSQRRSAGGFKRVRFRACPAGLRRAHGQYLSGFLRGLSFLPFFQRDLRNRQEQIWRSGIVTRQASGDSGRCGLLPRQGGNRDSRSATGSKCELREGNKVKG